MAEVFFKAPCVGPGSWYYFRNEAGTTTHIPDWHVAELDPKALVVIKATSEVPPEPTADPASLLRSHDWIRSATDEENAEVLKLRQKPDAKPIADEVLKLRQKPDAKPIADEVVQPTTRRRNVIPGSAV